MIIIREQFFKKKISYPPIKFNFKKIINEWHLRPFTSKQIVENALKFLM